MGFNHDMISPIFSTKPYQYQNNNISFKANINSSRLKFSSKDFFVNIEGYGKNLEWAEKAKALADNGGNLKENVPAEDSKGLDFFSGNVTFISAQGSEVSATFSGYAKVERTDY